MSPTLKFANFIPVAEVAPREVLHHQLDLEQGRPAQVALRLQLFHQLSNGTS